jgi:hypothetical protein
VKRIAVLLLALTLVASCGHDPEAPPKPTASRVATIVGKIVDWAEPNVSYRLDTGDVVEIFSREPGSPSIAMRLTDTNASPGGLLLAGSDDLGPFYGATRPEERGCLGVRGQGYLERDQIHLSSGLVLTFADDMVLTDQRGQLPDEWLLDFDLVCLDEDGKVKSITQVGLGV